MYIAIFIFTVIFIAQILLGLRSWDLKKRLKQKYSFVLGSQIELSRLLEKYSKKNNTMILRASDTIDDTAYAEGNTILIDKKSLHSQDLYSNVYLLFIFEVVNSKTKIFKELPIYQNVLFISQIVVFLIAIFILNNYSESIIIAAIIIQLVTLFLTMYALLNYHQILDIVFVKAKKFLKLDLVESARAEALIIDLKYRIFEYPFDIIWKIYNFITP